MLIISQATKIEFKRKSDSEGKLIASGVHFVVDGNSFVANASKEVILSAGAIQTPQLLELSGEVNFQLSTSKLMLDHRYWGCYPPNWLWYTTAH